MAVWIRAVPGALLCLVGALWIAQGTDAVHGSSMSGRGSYTALGVVLVVIGVGLLGWAWRVRAAGLRRSL